MICYEEGAVESLGGPKPIQMRLTALDFTGVTAKGFVPFERLVGLNGSVVTVARVETEVDPNDPSLIRRQWAVVKLLELERSLANSGKEIEAAWWSGFSNPQLLRDDNSDLIGVADALSSAGRRDEAAFWCGRASARNVSETSQLLPADEILIPLSAGTIIAEAAETAE